MRPHPDGPSLANRFGMFHPPVVVTAADPDPWPARTPPWWAGQTAMALLVLVGLGLRTAEYAGGRNLWIDEARLALNLVSRSPAELLKPLDYDQGAPVGFLLLLKGVVATLGASEHALRLIPFLGSLGGLLLFAHVAARVLPRPSAVLAVGLFAVSPYVLSYAAECKQYSTDVALAVGLVAVALPLLDGTGGRGRWAGLALAGAAAVWFSHPAAFVLGGIGTALLASAVATGDRGRRNAAVLTVGCWLVSFGGCYVVSLSQLQTNQYLLDFWAGHFLPFPPTSPGHLTWLSDHYFAFLRNPGGLSGPDLQAVGVSAVLLLVGLVVLGRERWPVAVALVVPVGLTLFASALHKYPFSGRLILFLVPAAVLLVARGAEAVAGALRPKLPFAAFLLVGLLGVAVLYHAYQELRWPLRTEQVVPVLAELRQEFEPGDKVVTYANGALPAVRFYTHDDPFPPGTLVEEDMPRGGRTAYREQLAGLKGCPRVWLVFSHRLKEEEATVKALAETLGRCDRTIRADGAVAYRFDFTAPPDR